MRQCGWLFGVALWCLLAASCKPREPEPEYRLTARSDIMDSVVDPSADKLWESVVIVMTAGTKEKAPHTDEEWLNVRRNAIRIVEATNLLSDAGPSVAKPERRLAESERRARPGRNEKRNHGGSGSGSTWRTDFTLRR